MKDDPHGITNSMRIGRTVDNTQSFINKLKATLGTGIDSKLWANFLFHQSLIVTGEAYIAKQNHSVTNKDYQSIIHQWYHSSAIQGMLDTLDLHELTIPKKVAAVLMKHKMYTTLGVEMYIHSQKKRNEERSRSQSTDSIRL